MRPMFGATIAILLAGWVGAPGAARADQFVFVDNLSNVKGKNAFGGSHYGIKALPDQPMSWKSPIDYTKGSAHVRAEVFTKPTKRQIDFGLCFEGYKPGGGTATFGIGCGWQTPKFTDPGVYTRTIPMNQLYPMGVTDWNRPLKAMWFVTNDGPKNVQINSGADVYPMTIRFTVTIVSAGGTYTPPGPTARTSDFTDGGVPDARPNDAVAMKGGDGGPAGAAASPEPEALLDPADAGAQPFDAAGAGASSDPIKTTPRAPNPDASGSSDDDPPADDPEPVRGSSTFGCTVAGAAPIGAGPALILVLAALPLRARRGRR